MATAIAMDGRTEGCGARQPSRCYTFLFYIYLPVGQSFNSGCNPCSE